MIKFLYENIYVWRFLGEGISLQEIIGMAVAALGVVLVQMRGRMAYTKTFEFKRVQKCQDCIYTTL